MKTMDRSLWFVVRKNTCWTHCLRECIVCIEYVSLTACTVVWEKEVCTVYHVWGKRGCMCGMEGVCTIYPLWGRKMMCRWRTTQRLQHSQFEATSLLFQEKENLQFTSKLFFIMSNTWISHSGLYFTMWNLELVVKNLRSNSTFR